MEGVRAGDPQCVPEPAGLLTGCRLLSSFADRRHLCPAQLLRNRPRLHLQTLVPVYHHSHPVLRPKEGCPSVADTHRPRPGESPLESRLYCRHGRRELRDGRPGRSGRSWERGTRGGGEGEGEEARGEAVSGGSFVVTSPAPYKGVWNTPSYNEGFRRQAIDRASTLASTWTASRCDPKSGLLEFGGL